jgi:hypothetical protein
VVELQPCSGEALAFVVSAGFPHEFAGTRLLVQAPEGRGELLVRELCGRLAAGRLILRPGDLSDVFRRLAGRELPD